MKARFFLAAVAAIMCSCTSFLSDSFIELEEERLIFPAAGDILFLQFTANASWTAESSDGSWCRISPGSGEAGLTTMKITALMNNSGDERSANVTISCGLIKKVVEIIQLEPNTATVDKKSIDVPSEGGQFQITVRHNVGFAPAVAEDSQSWISILDPNAPESKAIRDDTFTIEVAPNTSGWERVGHVLISTGIGEETVIITQAGADVFSLSCTIVEVPGQGGEFSVSVSGSVPYHISSMPDWISEVDVTGRTHTFSAPENTGKSPREGAIVFCDEGGVCLPLMVTQEGIPQWAVKNFRHQSLFMRFTATWCGWCPRMNKSIKKAQEGYPNKILHLALHGNGSNLYFSPADELASLYKISSYPTGLVDGRITINNEAIATTATKIIEAAKETENFYGTVSGARLETTVVDGGVDINATIYFKAPGNYLVTAFIVEDDIVGYQADYEDGDHSSYTHDSVARKVLTGITGTLVSQTGSYSTRDFQWHVSGSAKNMRLLVYVQAKYGSREKKRSGNFGEYYVDNCFTVPLGETLELETE